MRFVFTVVVAVFLLFLEAPPAWGKSHVVPAYETEPVSSKGDAADDTTVWPHPTEPEKSLIVAVDKKKGVVLYNFDGEKVAEETVGEINNIDSRDGLSLKNEAIHLIVGSNRSINAVSMFTIDPRDGRLLSLGTIPLSYEPYGICIGKISSAAELSVFVTTKDGVIDHWILTGGEKIRANPARSFQLESKTEGCVVDDSSGRLFVSEEEVGVWSFDLGSRRKPHLTDS